MKKNILFVCIFLLFSTVSFCQYRSENAKEITLEGVLRMYLHDNTGESKRIDEYQKTDGINETISFVLELDKEIDVFPYLDEDTKSFVLEEFQYDNHTGPIQKKDSFFMLVPDFVYDGEAFTKQFVNKKVRVTGSLYIPHGGWRNYTEIVMSLCCIEEIKE